MRVTWLQRLTATPFTVHGHSMEPTYAAGTQIWLKRWTARARPLARGAVIVFRAPHPPHLLEVKRIVGLPGETVAWGPGGRIQINGVLLEEPYARFAAAPPGDDAWTPVHLAPDEYAVAGDHRLHSQDSRVYGSISRRAIRGVVA